MIADCAVCTVWRANRATTTSGLTLNSGEQMPLRQIDRCRLRLPHLIAPAPHSCVGLGKVGTDSLARPLEDNKGYGDHSHALLHPSPSKQASVLVALHMDRCGWHCGAQRIVCVCGGYLIDVDRVPSVLLVGWLKRQCALETCRARLELGEALASTWWGASLCGTAMARRLLARSFA